MQVIFRSRQSPHDPQIRMSDEEYYGLCAAKPELRFERTAKGEIIIVPPAGAESDHHM